MRLPKVVSSTNAHIWLQAGVRSPSELLPPDFIEFEFISKSEYIDTRFEA